MTDRPAQITFNYTRLDTVIQGADAVPSLAEQIESRDSRRVFLMASRSLRDNSGVVDDIADLLGDRLAEICVEVPAHTPRPAVLAAIQRATAVQADLLVSVGGGSVIDAAKTVQLALEQGLRSESELLEYARFADGSTGPKAGEFSLFHGPSRLRQIAVPTTLSGAEFSNNAGVTDPTRSLKEGYRGPDLCPQTVIYDPALSLHTPDWLWLSTAIRSLDHAVEGYCSMDCHAYLEAHFLRAMTLLQQSLTVTRQDRLDLAARSRSQQAVWLACCGLGQVRHGASHGIGYLLGAVCGVPHGITSCVMLPAVLEWNSLVNGERQRALAEALGGSGHCAGPAVRSLVEALGLPANLQDAGVSREDLPRIAELASRHPVVRNNPRTVNSAADVLEILELAWN
ncbi:MAG: iron-containing alcohol dehydrogenase [Gammaproteobacteria bacterium]|nr:iron-containing alcohol dehydrogenase [Pseudomonadales bacterium]MCP5348286.1 iron-containing alcohol dehydrogenase [Pseudomonadales bacterium]